MSAVCCASERQHPELDSETKYYLRNRLIMVTGDLGHAWFQENLVISNTQPMRTPVNASPKPSRAPAHDSGTVWFATPSLEETCAPYSLPVSRRTHCQLRPPWYAPCVGGTAARVGRSFARLLCCPDLTERGRKKAPWLR